MSQQIGEAQVSGQVHEQSEEFHRSSPSMHNLSMNERFFLVYLKTY